VTVFLRILPDCDRMTVSVTAACGTVLAGMDCTHASCVTVTSSTTTLASPVGAVPRTHIVFESDLAANTYVAFTHVTVLPTIIFHGETVASTVLLEVSPVFCFDARRSRVTLVRKKLTAGGEVHLRIARGDLVNAHHVRMRA
jgi:hypothetical protein